jgi:hypothetical protein
VQGLLIGPEAVLIRVDGSPICFFDSYVTSARYKKKITALKQGDTTVKQRLSIGNLQIIYKQLLKKCTKESIMLVGGDLCQHKLMEEFLCREEYFKALSSR